MVNICSSDGWVVKELNVKMFCVHQHGVYILFASIIYNSPNVEQLQLKVLWSDAKHYRKVTKLKSTFALTCVSLIGL